MVFFKILPGPECKTLNVSVPSWEDFSGQYVYANKKVRWAPQRPVYQNVNSSIDLAEMYVLWNNNGWGWSIGLNLEIQNGRIKSKLNLNYTQTI